MSSEIPAYIIAQNRKEYGPDYERIKWADPGKIISAENERDAILKGLSGKTNTGYAGSKIDVTNLSPGCISCGEGSWSCLFINGKCNCRCFYCPTDQDDIGEPMTNTVPFPETGDYIDYINHFKFKGVSISGGEPLLTLERTLKFISEVRNGTDPSTYIWMYTNGSLSNREILQKLQKAGLDELRFDIGAVGYNISKAAEAVPFIKNVTVEIPAVPEDFEVMKRKLKEMKEAGIKFLNLHQMRLTPYNFEKLTARNYTFLHGEKVTVLESELTALKLIEYSKTENTGLDINYCSFIYKNRFQRSAARKRSAGYVMNSLSDLTEKGLIRSLYITGNGERLEKIEEGLSAQDSLREFHRFDKNTGRIYLSAKVLKFTDTENISLHINYSEPKILPSVSYTNPFKQIKLNDERNLFVEKVRFLPETVLSGNEIPAFTGWISGGNNMVNIESEKAENIARGEFLGRGLQKYF